MLTIKEDRCILCGSCVRDCFCNALKLAENKKIEWTDELCIECGHCVAVCPHNAVVIDGRGYDNDTVEPLDDGKVIKVEDMRHHIIMRRSTRFFTEEKISDEEMKLILEAGKYSPTGCNSQGNVFLVVRSEEGKKKFLDDIYDSLEIIARDVLEGKSNQMPPFLAEELLNVTIRSYRSKESETVTYNAPVIIVVFSDIIEDGVLAGGAMTDIAQSLGLGTCYIKLIADAFGDKTLKKKYGILRSKVPAIALILGKPKHKYFRSAPRKTPEVIEV